MAEEKEQKKKNGFRIHLSGNKYIIGNSLCYWIVSESHRNGKDGNQITVQKRLSGDHTNFTDLFDSYFRMSIRNTEIDGEIEDLAKLVKKTKAEIQRWFKQLDKVTGGDADD